MEFNNADGISDAINTSYVDSDIEVVDIIMNHYAKLQSLYGDARKALTNTHMPYGYKNIKSLFMY